jgi:glycosyltransferase involved in cell wall biosynthesis
LHQQKDLEIKVFYTWGERAKNKYDPGFGRNIDWDIPLMDGYPYQWVRNASSDPGTHHYKGIINPDIIEQIEQWQANALLIYGWAFDSHFKVMRHFKSKLPVYFRGDSTLLDNRKGLKNLFKTIWLRYVYRYVDHVFYTGSENKRYFKKYGLAEHQLTFAPHAIDNDRFKNSDKEKARKIRSDLGIKDADILVLFAAKFEAKKNPSLLISAMAQLKSTNVHLLMVGNGPLEQELKGFTQNPKVHWLDFQNQSEIPAVYGACDLFCLPSRGPGESWGLSVNEAMAAGKAVLVSDKAGCAIDLASPETTGEIFHSGDVDELRKKLATLTLDKSGLARLGSNGQKHIANWSFQSQVAAMIKEITK